MHTLIVGCGMAGAAAAIAAAERGDAVTVLDKNRKPLKKLGVTGNGRGNLLNACGPEEYGRSYFGDPAFAGRVLAAMPYGALRAFWEGLGVPLVQEAQGRVYPAAYQASVAVDALLLRMRRLGVEIVPGTEAISLRREGRGFALDAVQRVYAGDQVRAGGKVKKGALWEERALVFSADRVIVAAGGKAAPAHGTDGSAYGLLTNLGHSVTPLRPALCALVADPAPIKGLSGQRVRAGLTLLARNGGVLRQSRGEALFADDGLSGIAAMQLARFASKGCAVELDLREAVYGDGEAPGLAALERRVRLRQQHPLSELFTGAAVPGLAAALFKAAEIKNLSRPAESLNAPERTRLAAVAEAFRLEVSGVRGFEMAQITAGGLDTAQFRAETMESRLEPGLHAAGEMLNVDGDCGGFNLMFALAGGLLAGRG